MSELHTRKEKRTPVTLKIKFKSATLDQFIERYSVDVSQGGIFIRTKDPLGVGTQLRFEFQLQDASPLISGEGTVVWTREFDPSRTGVAPGMGVRFDRLAPESQAVLEQILQRKGGGKPVDSQDTTAVSPAAEKTRIAPQNLVNSLASQSRLQQSAPTPPIQPLAQPAIEKAVLPKGLHGLVPPRGGFGDEPSRDQTPLPKPMPFHVGGDEEFSEDVFEQPTKVASLENLLKHEEEQARAAQAAEAAAQALVRQQLAVREARDARDARARDARDDDDEQTAVSVTRAPRSAEMHAVQPAPAASHGVSMPAPYGASEPAFVHSAQSPGTVAERRPPSGERRPVAPPPERRQPSAAQRALATANTAAMPASVPAKRSSSPKVTLPPRMEPPSGPVFPVGPGGPVGPVAPVAASSVAKRSALPYVVGPVVFLAAAAALYFLVIRPGDDDAPPARPTPAKRIAPDDNLGGPPPPSTPVLKPAVTPPAAARVDVGVKSTPVGAQVQVDGVAHGSTPTTLSGLEQGKSYQVALNAACFKSEKIALAAAPGAGIDVKLVPLERVVHVVSDPPGASVIVDGKAAGRTPADVRLVGKLDPRAPHTFALRRPGFEDAQTTVSPDSPCATEGDIGAVGLSVSLTPLAKKGEPPAVAPAPKAAAAPTPRPAATPAPAKPEAAPPVVPKPEPTKAEPPAAEPPAPAPAKPEPAPAEPPPATAPAKAAAEPEAPAKPEPAKPEPKPEAAPPKPAPSQPADKKAEPASNKDCDPSPDAPEWARCK